MRIGGPVPDHTAAETVAPAAARTTARFAYLAPLLVLALATAACERPADEIAVRGPSREAMQAAPAGEVVARLRDDAEPGVTIYQPPPDLSRHDIGEVFVPSDAEPQAPGQAQPQAGTTAQPDTLLRLGSRR